MLMWGKICIQKKPLTENRQTLWYINDDWDHVWKDFGNCIIVLSLNLLC